MRRHDREVTDINRIKEVIAACKCCRLGLRDGERIYIVPLNFGWQEENGGLILYFHGAKAGRKVDLIKATGYAAFEMDSECEIVEAELACDFTAMYQSIIGEGTIEILEDREEKAKGLRAIMLHNSGRADWNFPDKMLDATNVYRLKAESFSCKIHE